MAHTSNPVEVVDYDPTWPERYAEERERIAAALAPLPVRIEHIGSTAVPGLAAKPVIDILVGVPDIERAGPAVAALIRLGYSYAPEFEGISPEQRYFYKGMPHTHHIHMVETASDMFAYHLAFRDYLRAHPEAAAEYARLKRGLAARFRDDRDAYTDGKADFVKTITAAARRAGETGQPSH